MRPHDASVPLPPSLSFPSHSSPSLSPVAKILEVGALPEGQEVVAIGTLYKDMKLKPSIMDEYAKDKCVGGGGRGRLGGLVCWRLSLYSASLAPPWHKAVTQLLLTAYKATPTIRSWRRTTAYPLAPLFSPHLPGACRGMKHVLCAAHNPSPPPIFPVHAGG